MGSCADYLHKLQADMGFTDEELEDAVTRHCTPREVKLPVFHEKVSKKQKKEAKKQKKKGRYQLAWWYLEKFLTPGEAFRRFYSAYRDYEEMVEAACKEATDYIQFDRMIVSKKVDPAEFGYLLPKDDFDIPDDQWKAFKKYCKKHPIKKTTDIEKRRQKFKKHLRKERRKYYDKRRLKMYDPLFAGCPADRDAMLKNIKRISRENEQRIQEFKRLLGTLYKESYVSSAAMSQFSEYTAKVMERHKRRMKEIMKDMDMKPNPITIYEDDKPPVIWND